MDTLKYRIGFFSVILLVKIINVVYLSIVQLFILLAMIVFIPEILVELYGQKSHYTAFVCGLATVISFHVTRGFVASMFIFPWLLYGLYFFYQTSPYLNKQIRVQSRSQNLLLFSSSIFFIGAPLALMLSRAGIRPLNFSHTIIELTAIHFHYAGITIPILMFHIFNVIDLPRLHIHSIIIAIGTPVVAIGISLGSYVSIIGFIAVVIFAGDLIIISIVVLWKIHITEHPYIWSAHFILIISMSLAIYYAFGVAFSIRTITISSMILTHGILNGLFFLPLSLIEWIYGDRIS